MKKIKILILSVFYGTVAFAQDNSYPLTGNVNIYQSSGSYRSYDVTNFNSNIVSRVEATTDGTGQLWLKDASGNYKVIIKSSPSAPSTIAGELIIGKFATTSENRKLFVEGTSEFTGKLYGRSDFELKQSSGIFRAYDIVNFNGNTVSRFEATTDGTGQLWFKDANGNYKVAIKSNSNSPSAIAGELVIGEYTSTSKGKKFYVKGDSWIEGQLGVDGKIRAEEVKVEIINGPDYVFEPDYELRTLQETKEYVSENKHLPEIPSAKEMEANGIDLGDMNMRLLKKIEELTLYQIELLDRLEKLETENARIDELEKKLLELTGAEK